MFSLRSVSVSFALSFSALAIASMLGGCTVNTDGDNVYSNDERRSDIMPIARGDASFPIAYGAAVPDANGNAAALDRDMVGVRVRFSDMYVEGNCESSDSDEGEFYFDLGINGRAVGRRDRNHYESAHEGDSVRVDVSRVFFVKPDEAFSVTMKADEADDFMNGDDDHVGSASIPYTSRTMPRFGEWQGVQLGHGDCAVTISYALDRVQ